LPSRPSGSAPSLALGATGSESDRSSEPQLYSCRNAMETGPGGRSRQIESPDANRIELSEPRDTAR